MLTSKSVDLGSIFLASLEVDNSSSIGKEEVYTIGACTKHKLKDLKVEIKASSSRLLES